MRDPFVVRYRTTNGAKSSALLHQFADLAPLFTLRYLRANGLTRQHWLLLSTAARDFAMLGTSRIGRGVR